MEFTFKTVKVSFDLKRGDYFYKLVYLLLIDLSLAPNFTGWENYILTESWLVCGGFTREGLFSLSLSISELQWSSYKVQLFFVFFSIPYCYFYVYVSFFEFELRWCKMVLLFAQPLLFVVILLRHDILADFNSKLCSTSLCCSGITKKRSSPPNPERPLSYLPCIPALPASKLFFRELCPNLNTPCCY